MIRRAVIASMFLGPFLASVGVAADRVEFRNGAVVSVSAPASEVGVAILRGGQRRRCGRGHGVRVGGGVPRSRQHRRRRLHAHPSKRRRDPTVVDYRETAPAAAGKAMFKPDESHFSHRVVGVPGTVRGLALAHQRFGKLAWGKVLEPAIRLAREGFPLDAHHAGSLNNILAAAPEMAELQRVFGRPDGRAWRAGDRLTQPDLAQTLRHLADHGPDAFYTGPVADLLLAEMKAGGGLINRDDLLNYRAIERQPIHGSYRGYDVYGPPPPSSGGICLVEMLNILANFELNAHGRFSPETLHLMIEAMRRGYCDRALYLGDPAFTAIPARLTTKDYARKLAQGIDPRHATKSDDACQGKGVARRRRQHDALFRHRQGRHGRGQHLYARAQLWLADRRQGSGFSAQQ